MTIKYEFIGSEALQRQIDLLKYYPEIYKEVFFFGSVLDNVAKLVKQSIRPNLPHHTGRLENALGSKVVGNGLGTYVDIGFGRRYGMPSAQYAAPLNEGAVAHEVAARRTADGYLHFSSRGRFTTIGSVQHPGFSGRHFMEAGLEAALPGIDALISIAADEVVEKLAAA
jgi:hypothetical protein